MKLKEFITNYKAQNLSDRWSSGRSLRADDPNSVGDGAEDFDDEFLHEGDDINRYNEM